jgi:Spy/CpxP family protein refolding chaperone
VFRAAILFAVSMGAFAQPPGGFTGIPMLPGPAMNYQALKQALGLTDAQTQQLQDLQKNRQAKTQAIYQQISDKQKQLNDALASASPDAAAIGQLEIDMGNLRKQIGAGQSVRDEALALLNDAQRAKLTDLQNALQLQRAANEAIGLGLISPPAPVVTPPMRPLAK